MAVIKRTSSSCFESVILLPFAWGKSGLPRKKEPVDLRTVLFGGEQQGHGRFVEETSRRLAGVGGQVV